ncbi:hypothetical protein [Terrihalobacillus insolitus]|uniref:hypothetical protein n=1 Tax=Terrihalobacillus insolitus TaxID=2950438 RepID=UPI00234289CB|nr:hypothetical protein [Terrihalobacillus insolitus]MDC3414745.1 hypothetical protein [Terrihalobacillus insolitus]
MIKRIVVALISTAIFSLLMAYVNYVPISEREANVLYTPLWSTAMIYTLYSLPVYLIGGIPSSLLIDKLVGQKTFNKKITLYLTKFGLYGVFGIVAAFLFLMVLAIGESETYLISNHLLTYMTLGLIASLIYYHISLLFFKKQER